MTKAFEYSCVLPQWCTVVVPVHLQYTTEDSKRHIIIRTAILYNEINSGQIMKKTLSNNMSKKVHMKGRQQSESKI